MAQAIVSAAITRKAQMLAEQAHTWARGRSKLTGVAFFLVPSSDGQGAHWAAIDGRGCTCEGHRRRGVCTHQLACQILGRRSAAAAAPAPAHRSVLDDLADDGSAALGQAIARNRAA